MQEIETALTRLVEVINAERKVPDEVLLGLGMLKSSISQWLSNPAGTLRAPRHGRWIVSPSGVHLDLVRRPTLRRLVAALVEARCARPAEAVCSAELIAAGWPGETAVTDASANRLRVALCRLRQAGLEHVLVTTHSGWMLKPNVPVERDAVGLEELETEGPTLPAPIEAAAPVLPVSESGVFNTQIPPALVEEESSVEDAVNAA
jgi:hypothetical protein